MALAAVGPLGTAPAATPTPVLTKLHAFKGGATDGLAPFAGVVFDPTGTVLYGTTQLGGTANAGTVFKFDPATGETTILHSFSKPLVEGVFPQAGVVTDARGMLYGTTISVATGGGGAAYQLDPKTKDFTVLHRFVGNTDGFFPEAPLVFDRNGLLYGTTFQGGGGCSQNVDPLFCGTVFKLDPRTKVLTILHAFTAGADGSHPFSGLTFGPDGMLYGATFDGGSATCGPAGCGTIFRIDPASGMLTTLHAFADIATDGAFPLGAVAFDRSGMIFGTTEGGGPTHSGTVFKLDPQSQVLTVLHTFTFFDKNGAFPNAGLTFNAAGSLLYGTTFFGGKSGCRAAGGGGCGTIYSFDPATEALTTLHRFTGGADGGNSNAQLVLDGEGTLFGTTEFGGDKRNGGTVFKITP
jgi:uncharacterized repeat protein (TIGR03803 family)